MREPQSQYAFVSATRIGTALKERLQNKILDRWLPPMPTNARILEIGAGRGEFAQSCVERGYQYVAVEPSDSLRQSLAEAGITTIAESVPPIAAKSEDFDLVHSFDFVEHLIHYREAMQFFNESYRVLKPGGLISVIAPNYRTTGHLFYSYEYQHTFVTTLERLATMLTDCGFDVVKRRSYLFTLERAWNWADRITAHTIIPIVKNGLFEGFVGLISSDLLFRIHKNAFDHVAVIARKPETSA